MVDVRLVSKGNLSVCRLQQMHKCDHGFLLQTLIKFVSTSLSLSLRHMVRLGVSLSGLTCIMNHKDYAEHVMSHPYTPLDIPFPHLKP